MMRSGQNPEFLYVEQDVPQRNRFDLTHDVKFTGRIGNIIPVMCLETLPGDVFDIKAQAMTRFQPLIAPVYHRLDAAIHYFFVPNRILWSRWEDWVKGNEAGYAIPQIEIDGTETPEQRKFMEYFGVPKVAGSAGNMDINALPFAAYQRIYNDYYRAQKITAEVDASLADGNTQANKSVLLTMRKIGWLHDYFTSALPAPQEQNPIEVPIGDVALKNAWSTYGDPSFNNTAGSPAGLGNVEQNGANEIEVDAGGIAQKVAYDPNGTLEVNAGTLTEFRRSNVMQQVLEKFMRSGNRYIEFLKNFFNVSSSDGRLQRPEYITGLRAPITISEVLNTTGTANQPQGDMSGHAVAIGEGNAGKFYCEEHGYIVGVYFVTAQPAYMDGMPRHFLKTDPLNDYALPEFAHIGEQAIWNAELFANGVNSKNEWGYIPRYSEYKFQPNRVAGDFAGGNLEHWTLVRKFASQPTLSTSFIELQDEDFRERIFAVDDPDTDHILVQVLNQVNAKRVLPVFSTPRL